MQAVHQKGGLMVVEYLPGNLHLLLLTHHLDLLQSDQFQPHLMQYVQNVSSLTYPSPTFEVVTGSFQLTLADCSFD